MDWGFQLVAMGSLWRDLINPPLAKARMARINCGKKGDLKPQEQGWASGELWLLTQQRNLRAEPLAKFPRWNRFPCGNRLTLSTKIAGIALEAADRNSLPSYGWFSERGRAS